jgi:23S rRNA (adenine2503-C2)-methyltransferase
MPIAKRHPLAELRLALDRWGLAHGEKLLIEYVLLKGINDAPKDAERVAEWLGGLKKASNVNLISFNEFNGAKFKAPDDKTKGAFASALKSAGCFVTFRKSRGGDIGAACGQLAK